MDIEILASLVAEGLSTRAIAVRVGTSQTTVRYWMRRFDLAATPRETKTRVCAGCGQTYDLGRNERGLYCSVKCHGLHRAKHKFERWMAGDADALTGPLALRRAVERRDGRECSGCHLAEWMGRPMPLELEHRDGNSANNSPANLCLLCPNCHALTPTYKNRNKGDGRHARRTRYAAGKSW